MPRRTEYVALASKVLAVAVEGGIGDWAAYVGAVPGIDHDREWQDVKEHGTKLPQTIAEILFPKWKNTYVWRA